MMRSRSPWSCSSPDRIKPEPTTPDSSPPESNYISDYPLCSPTSDHKDFDDPVIAILPPLSGPLSPATVIQSHYNHRLTQLIGQLATALSSLPPLVPAGPPNCPGFDGFAALASKPGRREFRPLRLVLGQVWGVPGGIRIEHITRGQQGTSLVLGLIERVGVDALSRLDDDEREDAVAWVRGLRDAATERSRYAEVEASQPLFEEDSPPPDSNLAIAPEQTWDEPCPSFNPKPYSSLYDLAAYDFLPSTYDDDDDDGASIASYASSSSSTSSSGYRPPTVSSAPRHLSYPGRDDRPPAPKRIKLIGAHVGSLPHPQLKRLSNNPSGLPRSASAPTLGPGAKPNPPTARVALRNATKAAAPAPKTPVVRVPGVPRSTPLAPVAMPILPPRPSLSGRAQRVRKMPTWLSDAAELPATPTTPPAVPEPKPAPVAASTTAQPAARDRDRRAARHRGEEEEPEAEDETRFKPETAVLARQPFGWWPSVVLNPKDAPAETVGTWEPKAYLIKSIPTGGDWRWLPPHLVEPFPLELCRQLLADDLPNESRFKAKAWREYRGDLEDAARIISDPMRLQKWLGRKTAAERGIASARGRK